MVGQSLLHFDITEKIGKGGMGEVYRAQDTKLGRDVALKILPAELSGDPEREMRFQREARALASLQHPNVASVYGFEEVEGTRFLIMELIEGEELTQRMGKGAVPVEKALEIARQIAAGLEAAHENGIVHRDLKPANIMETDSGEIKILDFGLAQAWFGDQETAQDSGTAPTMTVAMTQMGAVLGTAAYMSPEQARGKNIDRRTDIWAFGVILFEMLTGKKLFEGETISDTLAAVLRKEPTWDDLPVAEAPELCRLTERCLERNPKQRLRDIGEARIFLQDGGASITNLSFSQLGIDDSTSSGKKSGVPVLVSALVALVCLLGGSFLGWQVLARPEPQPILHTMLPPPPSTEYELKGTAPGPGVLSPDGTMVAFTATGEDGVTLLYLRHLDKSEAVSLSGTETANYPFWSPDSRYIGYSDEAGEKLKKVAVGGGPPVTICPATNAKGGAWNTKGEIIFAPSYDDGIFKVPAIGGVPQRLTSVGEGHDSHRHPRFLPDGEDFIFVARTGSNSLENDIFLASLDTTVVPRVIATSQAHADYSQGHLLTVNEGVLMATPFQPGEEQAAAGSTPIVENILSIGAASIAVFSTSDKGMMVFQTGASNATSRQLTWMDLATGAETGLGEVGQIDFPHISPDGTRAVVEVSQASDTDTDLWLVELDTGLRSRFTFAPGDETFGVWAPDGESIFYVSALDTTFRIMEQPVEGTGGTAIILESSLAMRPTSISNDGQTLLFDKQRKDGKGDVMRMSLSDLNGEPEVLITVADGFAAGAKFSPDNRWIGYHTNSSSGWDVFVMPAVGGARRWQVSTVGAVYPRWHPDGKRLWVSRFTGDLRVYDIDGEGPSFRVGNFSETLRVGGTGPNGSVYALHPDGQRLLHAGTDPIFKTDISYLHLVTDWRRGLAQ